MLQSSHQYKWPTFIKHIFDSTGNSFFWQNQDLMQTKNDGAVIKQVLIGQYKQQWVEE